MRTVKLNRKIRKNKRYNKTSKRNKMIRKGGTKRSREESIIQSQRKSTRGLPHITIRTISLGNGDPTTSGYNDQTLTKDEIELFVNNQIKPGYQIVCFPMPPDESHSILVNLFNNDNNEESILISEWGGERDRNIPKKDKNKWLNYTIFIDCLDTRFGRGNVNYYENDDEINQRACRRSDKNNGQGGCSEYVHTWIEKYIGKGENAIILKND
jgi:hypothetical protein